jgi:hypothetical protein
MKKNPDNDSRKPLKETAEAKFAGSERLAEQTRKLLGKHYASKYRAR